MWDNLADKISDLFDDLSYSFKRGISYMVGKGSVHLLQEMLGVAGVGAMVASAFTGSPAGILLMAATAGLSSALAQVDHVHRRRNLCNFYRDEIAAKLGVAASDVTEKHMEIVAYGDPKRGLKGNDAIREELEDSSKARWMGVALSFVSSITAMSVVGTFAHHSSRIVQALVGLVAYNAVKHPLHWTVAPLIGMERPTTHEKIRRMDRDITLGKDITPERVMSVFVEANPEVGEQIQQAYGKKYDRLPEMYQREIVEHFEPAAHLKALASDINHGRMKPAEMAFTVEGDYSGVPPMAGRREEKRGIIDLGLDYCKRCAQAAILGLPGRKPPEKLYQAAPTIFNVADKVLDGSQERAPTPQEEPETPLEKKFVGRFGIKPKDTSMGYAQQVEQSRANPDLQTATR